MYNVDLTPVQLTQTGHCGPMSLPEQACSRLVRQAAEPAV